MAVAGLRNVGTKVGYSSFGAEVGVSAPAGNCVNSSGADVCARSTPPRISAPPRPGDQQLHERNKSQSRHQLFRADRLGNRGADEIGQQQPHPGATHRPHAGGRHSLSRRRGGSAHLPEYGPLPAANAPVRTTALNAVRAWSMRWRRSRPRRSPSPSSCCPRPLPRAASSMRARASLAAIPAPHAGTAFHRLLRLVGRARGHHRERGGHVQGNHRSVSRDAHAHRHGQRRKQRHRDRDADGECRDQLGAVELRRPEKRLSRAARGDAAAAHGERGFLADEPSRRTRPRR